VGLSCKGFGEELLALFRAIEASRQPIAHLLLFGKKKKKKKKKKKLRRLFCFITMARSVATLAAVESRGGLLVVFL